MSYLFSLGDVISQLEEQKQFRGSKKIFNSVLGCIIDVTKPIFNPTIEKFTIQLKIIDDTLNDSSNSSKQLIRYASVFLFTQEQDLFRNISFEIGDIIYLHKLTFSLWNHIKLQAKFTQSIDSVFRLIVNGSLETKERVVYQKLLGESSSKQPNMFIRNRALELNTWVNIFFMTEIFNPTLGIVLLENYGVLFQSFNMVLQIKKIKKENEDQILILRDKNNNQYYFSSQNFQVGFFRQDQWILFRGVDHISTKNQLSLSHSGNILQLPRIFEQKYHQMAKYQAIYTKKNKSIINTLQTPLPINTLTKVDFYGQKPINVRDMLKIAESYRTSHKKDQIILPNFYLMNICVASYSGKLKLYHKQYEMLVNHQFISDLPTEQQKQLKQYEKINYIFQGQMKVFDSSIKSKKQLLNICLSTVDEKGLFFQQAILQKASESISNCLTMNLGCQRQKQHKRKAENAIYEKLQKLVKYSKLQNYALIAVEPIRHKSLHFRLIGTLIH